MLCAPVRPPDAREPNFLVENLRNKNSARSRARTWRSDCVLYYDVQHNNVHKFTRFALRIARCTLIVTTDVRDLNLQKNSVRSELCF